MRPEGEAVYRVKGSSGPLILKRALAHFASKGALDIDTLGEKNVEVLIDNGLVRDLADIFTLTKDDLLKLDRFADISVLIHPLYAVAASCTHIRRNRNFYSSRSVFSVAPTLRKTFYLHYL